MDKEITKFVNPIANATRCSRRPLFSFREPRRNITASLRGTFLHGGSGALRDSLHSTGVRMPFACSENGRELWSPCRTSSPFLFPFSYPPPPLFPTPSNPLPPIPAVPFARLALHFLSFCFLSNEACTLATPYAEEWLAHACWG